MVIYDHLTIAIPMCILYGWMETETCGSRYEKPGDRPLISMTEHTLVTETATPCFITRLNIIVQYSNRTLILDGTRSPKNAHFPLPYAQ